MDIGQPAHLTLSPEGLRQESARRHALRRVGPQESLSHSCRHRCLQDNEGLLAGARWGRFSVGAHVLDLRAEGTLIEIA